MSRIENIERLSSLETSKKQRDFITIILMKRAIHLAALNFARGTLLDVGCGNKPYLSLFGQYVKKYVGCDIAQSNLQKVDVVCDATDLKFDNQVFDTVFSTQVIEHVADHQTMLAEINRVLKPNGILILSGPLLWELHEEPYDFFRFTKYGFQFVLENNGFEVLDLNATGGKWAAVTQINLNIIYSAFMGKRGLIRWVLKILFLHGGLTWLFNTIGLWMDKKWPDELLTLNYVAVARKK